MKPVVSSALAAHLTHDPQAADVLADLETTGLLVSRVPGDDAPATGRPEPASTRYRIHPSSTRWSGAGWSPAAST